MIGTYSVLFHLLMVREGQEHSWLTGVYWTLTVMTTLGFGDITFHSDLGRAFTIVVLITGVIMLLIVLPFAFIRFFYAPWIEAQLKLRAPRTIPAGVEGHVVIFHMVEHDPAVAAKLHDVADGVFVGPAADRDLLREAGLEKAPSVILTTNDDAINIYLTVYCRRLNPELRIISRITHESNLDAVHRAGADFVLGYSSLGAESVLSILQARSLMMFGAGVELFEVAVPEALAGKTLEECDIGAISGVNVIAVQQDGDIQPNPSPKTPLPARGELLVVGTHEQRLRFARAFG